MAGTLLLDWIGENYPVCFVDIFYGDRIGLLEDNSLG